MVFSFEWVVGKIRGAALRKLCRRLTRRLATCFGATSASLNTLGHVTEFCAVFRALVAYLGAFVTEMLGVPRFHQHEMCRGAADFCASGHQAKVFRFDVPAAGLKAMGHGHAKTRLVAT